MPQNSPGTVRYHIKRGHTQRLALRHREAMRRLIPQNFVFYRCPDAVLRPQTANPSWNALRPAAHGASLLGNGRPLQYGVLLPTLLNGGQSTQVVHTGALLLPAVYFAQFIGQQVKRLSMH